MQRQCGGAGDARQKSAQRAGKTIAKRANVDGTPAARKELAGGSAEQDDGRHNESGAATEHGCADTEGRKSDPLLGSGSRKWWTDEQIDNAGTGYGRGQTRL